MSTLLLRFQLGQIFTEEYLDQSGAVNKYLEQHGVEGGVDAIKETVADAYNTSWEDAVAEFPQGAGREWPGGQRNLEIAGLTIQKLGLQNAEDKVGALTQAYAEMRRTGAIFDEPRAASTTANTDDMTPSEIVEQCKQAQSDAGNNPDLAFKSIFSRR